MEVKTNHKIKVSSLTQQGNCCPAQWSGETEQGLYVYIRYRWGQLTVEVGESSETLFTDGELILDIEHGKAGDSMETEELLPILKIRNLIAEE
jgi:hypothetical protein